MTIRNVSHEATSTEVHGGAGMGNPYSFVVRREVEIGPKGSDDWVEQKVLAHGERDVADVYIDAGQPVPEDMGGPYDGHGRRVA